MLTQERVAEITKEYGKNEKDTGSPEVQVALLTEQINILQLHLKIHKKDHTSRRGLMKMVGQRGSLLKYINKHSEKRAVDLKKKLGIRK